MKRLLLLVFLLPLLLAQTIVYYDIVPIMWDAVPPMAGSLITYEIVRAPETDPLAVEVVDETTEVFYDVPLVIEGDWIVGVRTVRTIIATNDRYTAPINWSNINGDSTPDPFIARYYELPEKVKNLRLR
jgi:hypothetical protein